MGRLFLVRHARPSVNPDSAASTWRLHPAALDDLQALAVSGRLPAGAAWYSSPEAKAVETARQLAGRSVEVVSELAEHRRATRWFETPEEFTATVQRAFVTPQTSAVPEWEPLAELEARLVPAVRRLLARHTETDVVLVGHGTAWTVLVSALTGRPPDLEAWATLRMPDVWALEPSDWGHPGAGWETGARCPNP